MALYDNAAEAARFNATWPHDKPITAEEWGEMNHQLHQSLFIRQFNPHCRLCQEERLSQRRN